MKKKIIISAIAVVLVAAIALAVFLPGGNNTPAADTYTYRTYTSVSPSNWNELTYQDNNDTQIMSYIGSSFYSYDFKFDADGKVIPGEFVMKYEAATKLEDTTAKYAEKWGLPADGKGYSYTITLREDLKWDDGTPIKAEDFVYTMKEQLNPLFQNYRADSFYNGATIIVNAQNYVKQGQKLWSKANGVYTAYTADLDSKLIFQIGPSENVECEVRTDLGFPASYDAAKTASYLVANYGFPITAANIDKFEGKTLAEIKANAETAAIWDKVVEWWGEGVDGGMDLLVTEYEFPATDFSDVGIFVGDNEYEIVLVLEKALPLLKEDGTLSYQAAYNMASLPLVHKAKFEAAKIAPDANSTLWTSKYNSSVETTASWGPYKLVSFQTGKQYTLERNENWYGYALEENKGLYQTDKIVCDTVKEWQSAWSMFQAGQVDGIGIDVSIANDYKNSERAYFTPSDTVSSMQLQSSKEGLKARESDGVNKTILTYKDFRKALSLAIDRDAYAKACTTAYLAGFGLFNTMHYYDVENGGVFRNSDEAKKVLCEIYAVDYTKYESLDAAVDAITGFNLTEARALLTNAYNEALAAGDIKEGDKVVLTFGSASISETFMRHVNFISAAWAVLAEGTPLEGKLEVDTAEKGSTWADDFRNGAYDVCLGGWSGAAWDPGYFLLAYLGPDYMYSKAWDTSSHMLTFTMKGVGENGADIEETMSLLDWYDCLNGATGAKYDWSSNALEESQRLQLIAALEKEVLGMYYTVPVANEFSASLLSYKVDYVTYEYNTFMSYGGIKYMKYNFTDAEWAAEVANQGGVLDYK